MSDSTTFIVVDRLPARSKKTQELAEKIGAEIVQMSMQYWPRELTRRLSDRLDFKHDLQDMPDSEIERYLEEKLASIAILDFLSGVSPSDLEQEPELPEAEAEIEAFEADF